MAANPQLTSYIKQQLASGDAETSIKTNLRSVGWPEADIAEAFKETSPAPAVAPAAPAVPATPNISRPASPSPSPAPATSPMSSPSVNVPKSYAPSESKKINLESFAPISSSPMTRPLSASPAAISFTAQKPMESIFQPKTINPSPTSPSPVTPMASPVTPVATPKKSGASVMIMIVMGLLIVGLGVLSWLLYKNNSDLKAQINTFTAQLNALTGEVNNSTASAGLASQISSLQGSNNDLDSQLALFLPPKTTTSTVTSTAADGSIKESIVSAQVPLTLHGIVGGGGKLNYTLTTSKGIVVNIKNSKDAKVSATLGPLVGTSAALTGTQTAGAREITVTQVNGVPPALPVVAPPPAATSTATTTTP